MHLLREKLVASKSRIVFVSSGAVRNVPDVSTYTSPVHPPEREGRLTILGVLDEHVKGGSGTPGSLIYCETKFIALLGANWWRRQLWGQCDVVAVSPGLIPTTGITRGFDLGLNNKSPDAKTPAEGSYPILSSPEAAS